MLNRLGQVLGLAGVALFAAMPAVADEADGLSVEESDEYGEYLVTSEGRSVYMFESDDEGESTCYDDCADAWPPLRPANGMLDAGEGVDEDMIDTIEREDGTEQVTYGGQPLYLFVRDTGIGEATGHEVEGFGAEWTLVSPDGGSAGVDHSDAVGSDPEADSDGPGDASRGVTGADDNDAGRAGDVTGSDADANGADGGNGAGALGTGTTDGDGSDGTNGNGSDSDGSDGDGSDGSGSDSGGSDGDGTGSDGSGSDGGNGSS